MARIQEWGRLAVAVGTTIADRPPRGSAREVCPEFCVNGLDLFLGMGRRGRGRFPFLGPSL
jgi:hypothetical protein